MLILHLKLLWLQEVTSHWLEKQRRLDIKLPYFSYGWIHRQQQCEVVGEDVYRQHHADPAALRRRAVALRTNHSPVFELELSKYEYVDQKTPIKVDGYQIFIYTAEMIVFEKLRAICQQLPEYAAILPSHTPRARARDFYDMWLIMDERKIDPSTAENLDLIRYNYWGAWLGRQEVKRVHPIMQKERGHSDRSDLTGLRSAASMAW